MIYMDINDKQRVFGIFCRLQVGKSTKTVHVVDSLSKPVDKTDEEVIRARETLESVDQEAVNAGSERTSPDVLKSADTVHGEPDDDQLLRPGLNDDTGAKVWVATNMSYPEETISRNGQGLPNTESSGKGQPFFSSRCAQFESLSFLVLS